MNNEATVHEPEIIGVTTEGEPLYDVDNRQYQTKNTIWYE